MGMTYETVLRNIIVDAFTGALNGGTIELHTAANEEVATLTFSNPAFYPASDGVATAYPITKDSDATGNANPVTKCKFKKSDGTLLCTGTVTTTGGGGEVELTNTTIVAHAEVELLTGSVTCPIS